MKEFNPAGLIMLMRAAPSATIVPVAIDGSWQLMRYGMRPVPFGVRVKCTVLAPISRHEQSAKAVVRVVEERIREAVLGES
jgi:1-acyl-sn-glycerol-3-phosphate acyltransferase